MSDSGLVLIQFLLFTPRLIGAVILPFVYGYHPKFDKPDPVMESTERGVDVFLEATKFGSFIVDIFPSRTSSSHSCWLNFDT